MFLTIQDDQGTDLYQIEFDFLDGDDDSLIKQLNGFAKRLDRYGMVKLAKDE